MLLSIQVDLQVPASYGGLDTITNMVHSNRSASGGTLGSATVPTLRLSSAAAINKASLPKPLTSAPATPRVRFQLDSDAACELPSGTDNSLSTADGQSNFCAKALPVSSSLAGNEGATSAPSLSQSLCAVHSQKVVAGSRQQEVEKGFLSKLTLALDDVAGTSIMPRENQSLLEGGSTDAHKTNSDQVSMSVIKVGGACAAQAGHAVYQELSADQNECAKHLSEQDCIAPMLESIRRRITVAEFQFAYAGYAARLALKHPA